LDGNQTIDIKRNAKAIEKALPSQASAIKRIIKKHKLNVKNVEDLVKLFTLLDT
jgi:hypothetical protein